MKPPRRLTTILLLLVVGGLLGYAYLDREMNVLHTPAVTVPIEIPVGMGARDVIQMLHQSGVVADDRMTLVYLALSGKWKALKAGEYLFDRPVSTREVIDQLVAGNIYLHRFTVPEGLTLAEVAGRWEADGFGTAEEFLAAAAASLDLVEDFEGASGAGGSLEGYLFPETYFFAIRVKPRQAIEAMVARFRVVLSRLMAKTPPEAWPLSVRETLILASLIEEEAAVEEERPLIASVFVNRLRKKIRLQCDPTVIYALEMSNRYKGRLTTADLRFDSPYNTYRYGGLPPGPISNPGARSLEAATRPAPSAYLYFVRTTEGRHTFSETLAAHNRAVAAYRAQRRNQD